MKGKGVSIRIKFSVFVIILITVILTATGFIFLRHEGAALEQAHLTRGAALTGNFAASCEEWMATDDDLGLFTILEAAYQEEGIIEAYVLDDDLTIRAHKASEKVGEKWVPPSRDIVGGRSGVTIYRLVSGNDFGNYQFTAPVTERRSGKRIGWAVLTVSRGLIEKALREGQRKIIFLALGSIMVGIVGAVFLVTIILRPVRSLAKGTEALGKGNLSHRIEIVSHDELGRLAMTFNDMAGKLEIAQKERIEREKVLQQLKIAHQIQEALLPSAKPNFTELDIASFYRAATEVGGDYYDFLFPARDKLGVVVADVSGKGIPGSLVMTMVRSVLRTNAGSNHSPREILLKTNKMIFDDMRPGMFVTAQCCLLDMTKGQISLSSAGHNGLFYLPTGYDEVEIITPRGMALGLDKGLVFDNLLEENQRALRIGDIFLMYTDGVTEAMNPKEEEFGEERLSTLIRKNRTLDAEALSKTILTNLEGFMAGHPQHDDITYVVIKIRDGKFGIGEETWAEKENQWVI